MTKTLFHVTPRCNVPTILSMGLLADLHTGRARGVWLCDADRLPWAVWHIAHHQETREVDLSILHINVNSLTLRKVRNGVYVHADDIPIKVIGDVIYYALGEPE